MELISFFALAFTGMFIFVAGSFGTWLLATFMGVTKWTMAVPMFFGSLIMYASIHFFGR